MLRVLVLILFLANGAYYAWSQGLLRAYGLAPAQQGEPQRLAQQVQPQALRLLSASELRQAQAQAQAEREPKECLQAGPLEAQQQAHLEHALAAALPAGSWQFVPLQLPARWIVYMGKYGSAEALSKKRAELVLFGLKPRGLQNPALEPGLSLGAYDTQAEAAAALSQLQQRGVRTARVLQERAALNALTLRLPALGAAQKAQLGGVHGALAGTALLPCSDTTQTPFSK